MQIKPKKWADFQHYKDRCPPWIKLQKSLLDDFDFHCLQVASRALAPMLWLIASESVDGVFDADATRLAFRLRMDRAELSTALKELIDKGFFIVVQSDSDTLADRQQVAVPEAEAEAEAETTLSGKPDPVPKKPKAKNYNTEATEVLDYLNTVCGTRFKPVQASMGLIASRLREGATVEEMCGVVDRKHKEWAADSKMSEFLRPKTLFNATNYASYQGAAPAPATAAPIPFDREAYEAKRKAEMAVARERYQREQEAIVIPAGGAK